MSDDKTTHFGFKTVAENEKAQKVAEVFHSVANRSDVVYVRGANGQFSLLGSLDGARRLYFDLEENNLTAQIDHTINIGAVSNQNTQGPQGHPEHPFGIRTPDLVPLPLHVGHVWQSISAATASFWCSDSPVPSKVVVVAIKPL